LLTLKEKIYMLKVLKEHKTKGLFGLRKVDPSHDKLVEKLEQMVRNEQVNRDQL